MRRSKKRKNPLAKDRDRLLRERVIASLDEIGKSLGPFTIEQIVHRAARSRVFNAALKVYSKDGLARNLLLERVERYVKAAIAKHKTCHYHSSRPIEFRSRTYRGFQCWAVTKEGPRFLWFYQHWIGMDDNAREFSIKHREQSIQGQNTQLQFDRLVAKQRAQNKSAAEINMDEVLEEFVLLR